MHAIEIKLRHNYTQFQGVFFYWLYLSLDPDFAPEHFCFILPNGKTINAVTEAIYSNYAKMGKRGVDALKGTRSAQLLATAYSSPDFELKIASGWHDKLIEHAASYYDEGKSYIDANIENPLTLSSESSGSHSLKTAGYVKLLLLRKED